MELILYATSLLTGGLAPGNCHIFFLIFVLAFGSMDRQDVSIHGYMCVDILILVYHLYNLIFSVLIILGSDN
jgi:hypothetical protein